MYLELSVWLDNEADLYKYLLIRGNSTQSLILMEHCHCSLCMSRLKPSIESAYSVEELSNRETVLIL